MQQAGVTSERYELGGWEWGEPTLLVPRTCLRAMRRGVLRRISLSCRSWCGNEKPQPWGWPGIVSVCDSRGSLEKPSEHIHSECRTKVNEKPRPHWKRPGLSQSCDTSSIQAECSVRVNARKRAPEDALKLHSWEKCPSEHPTRSDDSYMFARQCVFTMACQPCVHAKRWH